MGPKWTESCDAVATAGVAARAKRAAAKDIQRFICLLLRG